MRGRRGRARPAFWSAPRAGRAHVGGPARGGRVPLTPPHPVRTDPHGARQLRAATRTRGTAAARRCHWRRSRRRAPRTRRPFGQALTEAVQHRVRAADGVVGADLSGGLDSSTAVVLAADAGTVHAVTCTAPVLVRLRPGGA
ncbi:asparagine synthase-related protein [Streptomyces sp. NPDC088137]